MEGEEPQALSLSWVFGASAHVKHSVVNLSDGFNERICYIAAHTAIIYDKRLRRQIFLQGHTQPISCMSVTDDRSTIITCDTGAEPLMVVWNSRTGLPLRTIQRPHPHGVLAMDISPDGEWLATMSAADPLTGEQEVGLWSLNGVITGSASRPLVLSSVPSGDVQMCVRFNMNNVEELISNGKRRVYFWSWSMAASLAAAGADLGAPQAPEAASPGGAAPAAGRFKFYSPPLRSKDFKQGVGDFIMSVFVPGTMQALTGTSDGDLVVWDEQGITAQMGTSATDRRATKLMRVHSSPITLLSTIGDYLVTGGQDGYVRFYDPLLRIVSWFEDLGAGPIASVAFSTVLPDALPPGDAVDLLNRFMVPDFVVGTTEGRLVAVRSSSFEEYDHARRTGAPLVDCLITDVVAVAAHPTRAEFCVLGRSGTLQTWDSIAHILLSRRVFDSPPMQGASLCYNRDGSLLVVGFESGHLHIVDGKDFSDIHSTRNTAGALLHVAASSTGTHIAVADSHQQVLLYAWQQHRSIMRWEYLGRMKSHHGPIVSLTFGESPSGKTRLFSLGAEGRVVEYCLASSSVTNGLRSLSHYDFPVGVSSAPTALAFAPPLQYFRAFSADTQLLIADDAWKVRVFNPDEQRVQATVLGPTFAGPVKQIITCRSANSESVFLAYHTGERVVGLLAWPMDGDPAQTMGLIAHPGPVKSIAVSYDGRKLFTAGEDGTLAAWDISTPALDQAVAASAAEGPARWARVLADDDLLHDLRDYFVYAQLQAQGEDSLESRAGGAGGSAEGRVPLALVPNVLRAVGYYPSNADIVNLNNHIAYMDAQRQEDLPPHEEDLPLEERGIGFAELLALYVNHRPVADVTQDDVVAAFKELGAKGNPAKLGREALLTMLKNIGEPMDKDELTAALSALTGAVAPEKAMPSSVTAVQFSGDVLGFEELHV